jgi:hypothetical protein
MQYQDRAFADEKLEKRLKISPELLHGSKGDDGGIFCEIKAVIWCKEIKYMPLKSPTFVMNQLIDNFDGSLSPVETMDFFIRKKFNENR